MPDRAQAAERPRPTRAFEAGALSTKARPVSVQYDTGEELPFDLFDLFSLGSLQRDIPWR
jgi:hypothetical protein